jgi:hypothetical protein
MSITRRIEQTRAALKDPFPQILDYIRGGAPVVDPPASASISPAAIPEMPER